MKEIKKLVFRRLVEFVLAVAATNPTTEVSETEQHRLLWFYPKGGFPAYVSVQSYPGDYTAVLVWWTDIKGCPTAIIHEWWEDDTRLQIGDLR